MAGRAPRGLQCKSARPQLCDPHARDVFGVNGSEERARLLDGNLWGLAFHDLVSFRSDGESGVEGPRRGEQLAGRRTLADGGEMKFLGRDAPAISVEIITDVPGRDRLSQVETGRLAPGEEAANGPRVSGARVEVR